MPKKNNMEKVAISTVIVGAGQAGLSVARYLQEAGVSYVVLEKEKEIGTSWKNRYDSLVLDSFAQYSHLEGFPFPGDQKRQPTKDEVAQYLQSFAAKHSIVPIFDTEIFSIEKDPVGFTVTTNKTQYKAQNVVIATGPFNTPFIPPYAANLSGDVQQLHAKNYRRESDIPSGTVLVVGGGNSGSEIAKELVEKGRRILFSYKGKLKSVPSSQFSQWVAYRLGIAHVALDSLLGKLVLWYTKGKAVGMDIGVLLNNKNVISVGELIRIDSDGTVQTSNGPIKEPISAVIWSTGYMSDFSIITIADFDPMVHRRGVTNIPGLYVLNIRWQYSKSSSHLAGISRDAKYIASYIIKTIRDN